MCQVDKGSIVLAGFICQLLKLDLDKIQLWGIFSISDQGGKAPCGWDHLRAGSLSSIREQAEQAR